MSGSNMGGAVLVTGASGFVGAWLVPALRVALPDVTIMPTASGEVPIDGIALDVTDSTAVERAVQQYQPHAIINLAALSFVPDAEADPRHAYDVNLFGTMNLAQAVLRYSPGCRYIFIGSSEVYGGTFRGTQGPLNETALLDPLNLYASTKAAADLLIGQLAQRGLRAVRFRPFNHFGPGQSSRFVVPAFIKQIAAIERGDVPPVIEVGNMDAVRDFLDVRDVVQAYVAAVTRPEPLPDGTILNLASGQPRRIGDILDTLIKMCRIPISIRQVADRMRPAEIAYAVGNPGRAREVLGWDVSIPFERTLAEMLDIERDNRFSG